MCEAVSFLFHNIYEADSMLITPEEGKWSLFAGRELCTGSSTVLLFALGSELLCVL